MVGHSNKSKAARRRNNMRKKNRRDHERYEDSDDGCLFMRAFGTAREVINVTRILSGMPSVLIERDKHTPLSVEVQGDELEELWETVEQLGPELKRLCQSKSTADKAKHAAKNAVPPTAAEEKIPSDALIPLRRGRAISSNSLHLRAHGKARTVSNYIRILSGIPEENPKQKVETLDIEGDNLEELLVCLEKLGSTFKKRPRQRKEESFSREDGRVPRCPSPSRARSGNPGGRPPRREPRRQRHRREAVFLGFEEMMEAAFVSFFLDRLFS